MRENIKLALFASWFAIIGIPIIFLIISLSVGNFRYFLLTLPSAVPIGLSSLVLTKQRIKEIHASQMNGEKLC